MKKFKEYIKEQNNQSVNFESFENYINKINDVALFGDLSKSTKDAYYQDQRIMRQIFINIAQLLSSSIAITDLNDIKEEDKKYILENEKNIIKILNKLKKTVKEMPSDSENTNELINILISKVENIKNGDSKSTAAPADAADAAAPADAAALTPTTTPDPIKQDLIPTFEKLGLKYD